MRLAELLSSDRIDTSLAARDKEGALREMARLLTSGIHAGSGERAPSVEDVHRVLAEREAVASTGMGEGVAIPHGRMMGLTRFVGALAIQKGGVSFDAVDGRPASILFALIGPERAAGEHLKCLARISRLLRDESVRRRLRDAEGSEGALRVVIDADG